MTLAFPSASDCSSSAGSATQRPVMVPRAYQASGVQLSAQRKARKPLMQRFRCGCKPVRQCRRMVKASAATEKSEADMSWFFGEEGGNGPDDQRAEELAASNRNSELAPSLVTCENEMDIQEPQSTMSGNGRQAAKILMTLTSRRSNVY
nr:hypothetical protein CFP56_65865 [Quercus suber]